MENVGGKRTPTLYFENLKSGLILTKAVAGMLAEQLGDETDHWTGVELELSPPQRGHA